MNPGPGRSYLDNIVNGGKWYLPHYGTTSPRTSDNTTTGWFLIFIVFFWWWKSRQFLWHIQKGNIYNWPAAHVTIAANTKHCCPIHLIPQSQKHVIYAKYFACWIETTFIFNLCKSRRRFSLANLGKTLVVMLVPMSKSTGLDGCRMAIGNKVSWCSNEKWTDWKRSEN